MGKSLTQKFKRLNMLAELANRIQTAYKSHTIETRTIKHLVGKLENAGTNMELLRKLSEELDGYSTSKASNYEAYEAYQQQEEQLQTETKALEAHGTETKNYSIRCILYFEPKMNEEGVIIRRYNNARFTTLNGKKVEAVRLRGIVSATEVIFEIGTPYQENQTQNLELKKIFYSETDQSMRAKYLIGSKILRTDERIEKFFMSDPPLGFCIYDIEIATIKKEQEIRNEDDPFVDQPEGEVDELAELLKSVQCKFISNRFVSNRVHLSPNHIMFDENDECCLNALLNVFAHNKKNFTMSKKMLLKLLNRTEEDIKNGVSIRELIPVFEYYKLSVKIYNCFNRLVYERQGDEHRKTFYALIKDHHMYIMDKDTHQIPYIEEFKKANAPDLKVSSMFKLKDETVPRFEFHPIHSYSDIETYAEKIIQPKKEEEEASNEVIHKLILFGKSLSELYLESRQQKYDPITCFRHNELSHLLFRKEKINICVYSVEAVFLNPDAPDACPHVEWDKVNLLATQQYKMSTSIFNRRTISDYDKDDAEIFQWCSTKAQSFCLKEIEEDITLVEIDRRKSYRSVLIKMDQVPVFNIFDNWTIYDNHEVEDMTEYYISGITNEFFLNTYNRVYGKFLKHFISNHKSIQIHAYKRPSNVVSVSYGQIVEDFLSHTYSDNSDLDEQIKKQMINIEIGKLEMASNKKSKSTIFTNKFEAFQAQIRYGGRVERLDEGFTEIITQSNSAPVISALDKDIEEAETIGESVSYEKIFRKAPNGSTFYVHIIDNEKKLDNGFKFIKELLLQTHNFEIYQDLEKLKQNDIPVFSVKTDALTIRQCDMEKAQQVLSFGSQCGQWRFSKVHDQIILPVDFFHENKNMRHLFTPTPELNQKTFDNDDPTDGFWYYPKEESEWDLDCIANYIKKNPLQMIRADLPGSGKSYIAKFMKAILTTPTNKLSQEHILDGVVSHTINKFFGVGMMSTDDKNNTISKVDDSNDVICFDEVAFLDMNFLTRIYRYRIANPGKVILGTGDMNQLENFNIIVNNIKDKKAYLDMVLNKIFGYNEIRLKECKRITSSNQKQKLKDIFEDLFIKGLTTLQIINKYFLKKLTKTIITNKAVCYFNETCHVVNSKCRTNKGIEESYMIEEHIVGKNYFKTKIAGKKHTFYPNFEYVITGKTATTIQFVDITDKKKEIIFELPISDVQKYFDYAYANTCHSFQGSSTNDRLTIYDWNCKHVSKEWLWVAMTRCRNLDNVYFYNGPSLYAETKKVEDKLKKKIEGYKSQDMKANRVIDEKNYITVDTLKSYLKQSCYLCFDKLNLDNMSADRIDNEFVGHTIDNCRPCCITCNKARSNHF